MTISATLRKRDKLAAQLTWLANRQVLGPAGKIAATAVSRRAIRRRAHPAEWRQYRGARGRHLAVGRCHPTDQRPEIGAPVTIGKTPGRVVRHLEDGFAIEFIRLQHPDSWKTTSPAGKAGGDAVAHWCCKRILGGRSLTMSGFPSSRPYRASRARLTAPHVCSNKAL
jgi:hypothetical protein